jgi:hypothetical protein
MRRALFLATIPLAALALTRIARADNPGSLVTPAGPMAPTGDAAPPPEVDKPAERRSGAVLGLSYGAGLGSSSGYPNDSSLIGDPSDYSASGLMAGSGGSGFVMGALSDYLNFGFWFGAATFANAHWHSTGQGGGFRLEIFPLFGLGRGFRDLAAFTQVGIGATKLEQKSTGATSTGVESFVSAGVFYDFWLCRGMGGHFGLGPSLEYDAIFSESMERHGALLGARFAWYGGR